MVEALTLVSSFFLIACGFAYHARHMWVVYKEAYEGKHEKLMSVRQDLDAIKERLLSVSEEGENDVATRQEPPPDGTGAPLFILVQEDLAELSGSNRVIEDLYKRAETGREKYGQYLKINNGREAAVDAYQEALDLLVYMRQMRIEGAEGVQHFDVKVRMAYESVMHAAIFLQEVTSHES